MSVKFFTGGDKSTCISVYFFLLSIRKFLTKLRVFSIVIFKENIMDVLILCAGSGKRFGSNKSKLLQRIAFKPLIYYSIKSFNNCPITKRIFLVVPENEVSNFHPLISRYKKEFKKVNGIIIGGDERVDSVRNGLKYFELKGGDEFIAIHDGARPFIKIEMIEKIFSEAKKYGAAAPGIKVVDTIKSCSKDMFIENHLKRDNLVAIQTPQIFRFKEIVDAYNFFSLQGFYTDDTELFSKINNKIKIVEGDRDLIKITYKEDLVIAKTIYKRIKNLWR